MAVSLLFGSLVATFLTLVVIPLGCISARHHFSRAGDDHHRPLPDGGAPTPPSPAGPFHGGSGGSGGPAAAASGSPAAASSSARPARLQRRSEETPAAGEPVPTASSGRPPRLARKGEQVTPSAAAVDEPIGAAAPAGRPPRLMKRAPDVPAELNTATATATAAVAARPPRLVRKSDMAAPVEPTVEPGPFDQPFEMASLADVAASVDELSDENDIDPSTRLAPQERSPAPVSAPDSTAATVPDDVEPTAVRRSSSKPRRSRKSTTESDK